MALSYHSRHFQRVLHSADHYSTFRERVRRQTLPRSMTVVSVPMLDLRLSQLERLEWAKSVELLVVRRQQIYRPLKRGITLFVPRIKALLQLQLRLQEQGLLLQARPVHLMDHQAAVNLTATLLGKSPHGNHVYSITNFLTCRFSTHVKWVVMIIVMFVVIVGTWIVACLFRRRYLRKKEREIEMLPPVALGPHQLQAMTGGYRYGDGVVDANRGAPRASGHHKEMASVEASPANGSTGHRGLMKKVLKRDR